MLSRNLEKSLQDWKLPPSSASDIFGRSSSGCFFPDCSIKTVEEEVVLHEGSASFPLITKYSKMAHRICNRDGFIHVGMIQVALKPTKLDSDTYATISLSDNRLKYPHSVRSMVESSLRDGPIHFTYFPTYCVHLADSCHSFGIDVEIGGEGSVTLMYRFHYNVVKLPYLANFTKRFRVDEHGKTTFHLTKIAEGLRVVSKTISWGQGIGLGSAAGNELASSSAEMGSANVDWKETAKGHVLKVDVPGFRKEEVRVVVEGDGILQISGERSEGGDGGEEGTDKWHCVERSKGRFVRRLRMPQSANLDDLEAAVENGVLTLTVPKKEVVKTVEVKVIDISG